MAEVKERKADDRGRVRIGPEYAGEEVEVVVIPKAEKSDAQPAK